MKNLFLALCALSLFACSSGNSGGNNSGDTPKPSPVSRVSVLDIQGNSDQSPLVGEPVTLQAVVTGDFQDFDADDTQNLGGFFVQQDSADRPSTVSTGIFVYDNEVRVDVAVGDLVAISATVVEYFGETQLHADALTVVGRGTIAATDLTLPASGLSANSNGEPLADLEAFEGMLVRIPGKLSIASLRFLERYGEVGLVAGERPFQYTNNNPPSASGAAAHDEAIALRSIILDDGLRDTYPANIRHLRAGSSAGYSIRAGDSITGLTGVLRYSRGSGSGGDEGWRLLPTTAVVFAADNPRPGPPEIDGDLRVAGFNVLNYFPEIDTGQAACGPGGKSGCRGADSAAELTRQLDKIVTAILQMDADIVGLVELENNASDSLTTLVNALNNRSGNRNYSFVDTGTIHTDAIKTGFIYDAGTIQPSGPFAILDSTVDPRFVDRRSRPALAQTFQSIASGGRLTVVNNHLKSKGSSCEADGDPNTGDGQGNCNQTRSNAARALADWSLGDPTGSGDPDVLIIGDLNAYLMEDPLTALKAAGFTNLLDGEAAAWSYVFDGKAGALDHALASPSLLSQVRETVEWHINADEPALLDYNLENSRDASLFDPDLPYRASDHDPVIVGLDLSD